MLLVTEPFLLILQRLSTDTQPLWEILSAWWELCLSVLTIVLDPCVERLWEFVWLFLMYKLCYRSEMTVTYLITHLTLQLMRISATETFTLVWTLLCIHKAKKSRAVQGADCSCTENFRRVFFKFLSEPEQRVNLAAAQFNQHLSAMCGPLLPFSPSLVKGVVWLCDTCQSGFAKDSWGVR